MNEPFEPPSGAANQRYKNSRNRGSEGQIGEHIHCAGGAFSLPASAFARLEDACTSGLVYLRQDEDTLTISPVKLADGRRRRLNNHYRVTGFRTATRLAVMELGETIVLMPVQWRGSRAKNRTTPERD
jgi:hypothetical protein